MACSSREAKNFLKLDTNLDQIRSNNDPENDSGDLGLKLRRGMFQNMDLFHKNVFTQNQHGLGKTIKDESGAPIRRSAPMPLVPPESPYHGGSRRISFLEQALLPGIKEDALLPVPTSSSTEQSKTAQLTIFYAGVINVYDDVPNDKAQAIICLASQCSSPIVKDVQPVPRSNSPSLGKKEDLPIARRNSLKHFLEKRRDRIISKFPYSTADL